jgi:hypothetical protein
MYLLSIQPSTPNSVPSANSAIAIQEPTNRFYPGTIANEPTGKLIKRQLKMMMTAAVAIMLATGVQAQTMSSDTDWHGLTVNGWQWQRHDVIKDMCSGRVTFTNTGSEAVGNIHYRTYYISETGVIHQNSLIDGVIEKLIQPGQSRTIELESFLVPQDCVKAGITFLSCEVLSQLTVQPEPTPSDTVPAMMSVGATPIQVQVRKSVDQSSGAPADFIVNVAQMLNDHDYATFAQYLPAKMRYFGHAASQAWIARDMAGDARNYSSAQTIPNVATYSSWTDAQGLIHESMQEETFAQEVNGKKHHAHCLFQMVRSGQIIQSLDLSVIPGKLAAK